MLEYINQLRARGYTIVDAAVEGAVLRLRPIMMTMLVATLGLLPAALSHAIGSDSQRPFAIVIVGGLIADLALSIFILPTFYVWVAKDTDALPEPEESLEHKRYEFPCPEDRLLRDCVRVFRHACRPGICRQGPTKITWTKPFDSRFSTTTTCWRLEPPFSRARPRRSPPTCVLTRAVCRLGILAALCTERLDVQLICTTQPKPTWAQLLDRARQEAPAPLQAAKDMTAETRSLVADNERTLTFQVATLFVNVQLAESTVELAEQDLKSYHRPWTSARCATRKAPSARMII